MLQFLDIEAQSRCAGRQPTGWWPWVWLRSIAASCRPGALAIGREDCGRLIGCAATNSCASSIASVIARRRPVSRIRLPRTPRTQQARWAYSPSRLVATSYSPSRSRITQPSGSPSAKAWISPFFSATRPAGRREHAPVDVRSWVEPSFASGWRRSSCRARPYRRRRRPCP